MSTPDRATCTSSGPDDVVMNCIASHDAYWDDQFNQDDAWWSPEPGQEADPNFLDSPCSQMCDADTLFDSHRAWHRVPFMIVYSFDDLFAYTEEPEEPLEEASDRVLDEERELGRSRSPNTENYVAFQVDPPPEPGSRAQLGLRG